MSSTVIVAMISGIGVLLAAALSYLGGKFAVNQSRRANVEDRDADWNAGYRAAAEPHLFWDVAMVAAVNETRQEINTLRAAAGLEPKVFEPIPPPPPLFPRFEGKGK